VLSRKLSVDFNAIETPWKPRIWWKNWD